MMEIIACQSTGLAWRQGPSRDRLPKPNIGSKPWRMHPTQPAWPLSIGSEIFGFRVVKDQRRDRGFGVHHVPVGQFDPDVFGLQQREQFALVGEVGAGGVAEAHANALVLVL